MFAAAAAAAAAPVSVSSSPSLLLPQPLALPFGQVCHWRCQQLSPPLICREGLRAAASTAAVTTLPRLAACSGAAMRPSAGLCAAVAIARCPQRRQLAAASPIVAVAVGAAAAAAAVGAMAA